MRQIAKQVLHAFINKENFNSKNTTVTVKGKNVELRLHGHLIAELIREKRLFVDNCGWFTNVTKDRLNILPGVSIYQKNKVWYLNGKVWDGKRKCVNSDYYMLVDEIKQQNPSLF